MTGDTPPVMTGALPGFGHAWALLRDPIGFLCRMRDDGEMVTVKLGPKKLYAVCSPALIGELLIRHGSVMDVGGRLWDTLTVLIGEGLATSNGEVHRRQRRAIQPAFTPARLDAYASVMEDEARSLAGGWRSGQVVDVDNAAFTTIARIMSRTLFHTESVAARAGQFSVALREVFGELYRRVILPIPWLHQLPTARNRRFDRSLATLHAIIREAITERRASGVHHDDLLAMLLNASDDDGRPLQDQEIHDHLISFLVAGTGNVSGLIASTLHLLVEHPEHDARLRHDIDTVAAGHPLRVADLPKLPYLTNVVMEALRLRSTDWILTRRVTSDITIGGYRIPAGADVLYSNFAFQQDPRCFADPERFDPDRWLPERAAAIPKHAMIPFGIGKRRCPGEQYALIEAAVLVGTIVSRWHLAPTPETDSSLQIGITLHPKCPLLRVQARTHHSPSHA